MERGWGHRINGVLGVAILTGVAVALINSPTVQEYIDLLPVLSRLQTDPPHGIEGVLEIAVTVLAVVGACLPLYKPRPRRILDIIALAHKRVVVALLALAALGYFDYTYRLPRLTLLGIAPVLLVVVPAWLVWIRERPTDESDRAIIVGDDPDEIERLATTVELPLRGYLCPTGIIPTDTDTDTDVSPRATVADGGLSLGGLERLGGLSRLEDVLVEYDIDTVVLAFGHPDRAEFFGALDACYEHGVDAKVHHEYSDQVLTSGDEVGTLVDVDIEPWDIQDYLLKRAFDLGFALTGFVVLSPVILGIAIAIKVDDGGSILYAQERTAVFGETFPVYKFRSMIENAEAETGVKISDEDEGGVDPRVTRVGRVLRRTHLDEIPQLWSVLKGDMSVVGPRPERPELDSDIRRGVVDWHKRWFVKPGLTGPAQVNEVTGAEPDVKLQYDLLYVKQQSFGYDLKMVARQIWKVLADAIDYIALDRS